MWCKKNIIFRIQNKKREKYINASELIKPQQYEMNRQVKFTNFTKNKIRKYNIT